MAAPNERITVEKTVNAPLDAVWHAFNDPHHIRQWDASADWRVTAASNDLRVGGLLELRLVGPDGGTGIDYVEPKRLIAWRHGNRFVCVEFVETASGVTVRQTFDAEPAPSLAEQRADWTGVLDRFARHVAPARENAKAGNRG